MNSKSTIYLSLILCSSILGFMLPLGQIIGAPISLIFLALFQPYFGHKKTLLIFSALFLLWVSMHPQLFLSMIEWCITYYVIITVQTGITFPAGVDVAFSVCVIYITRLWVLGTAEEILKKIKFYKRLQL
jgi:fumarate reductase subunit D